MSFQIKPESKTCGRCGKTFECFSHSGGCWCEKLPSLPKTDPNGDCLCPDCLKSEIQNQLLKQTNPKRSILNKKVL